jgi:hypothetical protein
VHAEPIEPVWKAPGTKRLKVLKYDKVPEAIKFPALAQKHQSEILESKDAISDFGVIWRVLTQESRV